MGFEIICTKGSGTNDSITITDSDFEQESGRKLSNLRAILETKKINGESFICSDNTNFQYRFVMPEADRHTENYTDRILAKETERLIDFKDMLLKNKNEIVLTNTKKTKKPDLIGFSTNYWSHHNLRVSCRLKKSDDTTRNANKDKFEPILLENVVPTNEKISLNYENVCICCENSVIEFPIRCWGTVGFEYKATLASGELIRQNAVHWAKGDKNLFGETCIRAWSGKDGDKNIVIKAIENVSGIDPATKVKYQKLTFTARDMLSWIDGDKVIDINTPKDITLKSTKTLNFTGKNYLAAANANATNEQQLVSGEDLKPGTIVEGDKTHINYGTWHGGDFKPWEEPEGTITIFLFVFSSLEKAKAHIDRYNLMPPNEQKSIWE